MKVGDKVVCILADSVDVIQEGDILTVSSVFEHGSFTVLLFEEVELPYHLIGWLASCFRKLDEDHDFRNALTKELAEVQVQIVEEGVEHQRILIEQ
jgi:hypothetical protein